MKRRSARPFVVEIKHTHTSRPSQNQSAGPARPGKPLWPTLPPEETEQPADAAWYVPEARPSPDVQPVPSQPEAPARRILQSLLPMFVPGEPEPGDEAAASPEPPVARRVGRPRKAAAPAPAPIPAHAAEPDAPVLRATPAVQPAVERTTSTKPVPARRRQDELGPGQRWKKRLNRYCR
ncbi:hypothetical protein [Methylobacterium trifolii]|uniref:Uncharacterized protein n=1 Tax=Methylobacterium trifolii TaxID=1003092 RepID=A0ABQ4TZJ7_9HYPH|nr:hypothetical protein [Methylobacterium trifolii]GJE59989.1 hypothetical protein MPOCJGCO_2098 [Methylobacterium trifolii]